MAKKDENGRLTIPKEFVDLLSLYGRDDRKKSCFFLDTSGNVGIALNLIANPTINDLAKVLPKGSRYLGRCNYDKSNFSFLLPENVETALGEGEDYFFGSSTDAECANFLYIYKKDLKKKQRRYVVQVVEQIIEAEKNKPNSS